MIFCPNRPLVKNGSSITGRYSIDSRKTSHWEVFLKNACRLFLKGAFLLQKPPLFQSKLWIEKFTRKGAFTDKVFRLLWTPPPFEKGGRKLLLFYFISSATAFGSSAKQLIEGTLASTFPMPYAAWINGTCAFWQAL